MSAGYEKDVAKGIARAFYVSHWADTLIAYQQANNTPTRDPRPLFIQPRNHIEFWEASTPKVSNLPQSYYQQAWRLIGRIEDRNEAGIDIILRIAMKADGYHFGAPDGYAIEFGRYLGYHSTGHVNISWFDDHAMFGLIVPEFTLPADD